MRKQNHLYTEDTYHGQAPPITSEKAQEMVEKDPVLKEVVKDIENSENKYIAQSFKTDQRKWPLSPH